MSFTRACGGVDRAFGLVRRSLLQAEGLPFGDALTPEQMQQAFDAEGISFGEPVSVPTGAAPARNPPTDDDGIIDTLFCNDEEVAALMQTDDLESAVSALSAKVPTLVVTRGANGALAVQGNVRAEIAAETVARVVDTTGAGDTFTSGFLAGQLEGRSLADSLTMGAICAAECIGHYGPRPEADLRALVDARLS